MRRLLVFPLIAAGILVSACSSEEPSPAPADASASEAPESSESAPSPSPEPEPEPSVDPSVEEALSKFPTAPGDPEWCGPTVSLLDAMSQLSSVSPDASEAEVGPLLAELAELTDVVREEPTLPAEVEEDLQVVSEYFSDPDVFTTSEEPALNALSELTTPLAENCAQTAAATLE